MATNSLQSLQPTVRTERPSTTMVSAHAFVVCATGSCHHRSPNPNPNPSPAVTSRRRFITIVTASIATSLLPLAATVHSEQINFKSNHQVAEHLFRNCKPYLQCISPINLHALMYRGAASPVPNITVESPHSDLFDISTYADENAVHFFQSLNTLLAPLTFINPNVPHVSNSHLATGSAQMASEWGGYAHTIWPTSNVRFAVWNKSDLFYASGDSVFNSIFANEKGRLKFDSLALRHALEQGREVMFESPSFYILPSNMLIPVVEILQSL